MPTKYQLLTLLSSRCLSSPFSLHLLYPQDYVHHVTADGEVANYMAEKAALADMVGGSPPYKHEGIAIHRDRWDGSWHNIWIADANRYIFNIRWTIGGNRFVKCPWVGRRVIGCCFTDQPCQNMATDDCWAAGGFYVGKSCEVDTCASTAFGPDDKFVTGCPNSTYCTYIYIVCRCFAVVLL